MKQTLQKSLLNTKLFKRFWESHAHYGTANTKQMFTYFDSKGSVYLNKLFAITNTSISNKSENFIAGQNQIALDIKKIENNNNNKKIQ